MGTRIGRTALVGALLAGATAVATAPAERASALTTFFVTSALDAPWSGTPGVCQSTAPGGACTLRAALGVATDVLETDDVTIDVNGIAGATITTDGELIVPDSPGRAIRITGSVLPDERVLIQAGTVNRVMSYDGGLDDLLEITGVALRGGDTTGDGGGLSAEAFTVVLRNVEVSGNRADIGGGGGVYAQGRELFIEDSVISGNQATDGGGIDAFVESTIVITRTEINDNLAFAVGGGVWVRPGIAGTTTVRQSVLVGNSSGLDGAAILCQICAPGDEDLVLDAVSVGGADVDVIETTGNVVATNLTISDTDGAGAAIDAFGGELTHTTIAGGAALTGTFTARSSVLEADCDAATIDVPAGESFIAAPSCDTVGGAGTIITAPFALGIFGPLGGVRTGSGGALPVAQLTDLFDQAPCRAATDARGLTRPATGCEHGAVESSQVPPDLALTVDTPGDTPDAITGDGICADALGSCTLRAAVMEAEAFPSNDVVTIGIGASIALEAPAGNGTYACQPEPESEPRCGDLDLTFLTIRGDVAAPVEIVGAGVGPDTTYRVFETLGAVTLEGLDLVAGTTPLAGQDGGVIRANTANGLTVTLRDTQLRGARVINANGGGLSVVGDGDVVLERVVVDGTQAIADGSGGGIHVGGTAAVTASDLTVSGTFAEDRGTGLFIEAGASADISNALVRDNLGGLEGGGLACDCTDVELRQVTFARNSAGNGGAISYRAAGAGAEPALRMINVSVLDNDTGLGGAVSLLGDGVDAVDVRLDHVTITGNEVIEADPPSASAGLGVDLLGSPGGVTVADSVIDGNLTTVGEENCAGPITTEGAVFTDLGCTVVAGTGIFTEDPQLQPIVDVAIGTGSQPYRLASIPVARPAFASPVVDATSCNPAITIDVIGTARPQGAACDAGSIEVTGISLRLFPSSSAPIAAGSTIPLADLSPSAVKPRAVAGGLLGSGVAGQTLRASDLQNSPLGSIPLGSIPLGSIPLGSIPLGSIPLGSIPLDLEGGWAAILAGTDLEGVPEQNVTFGEVVATVPDRIDEIPLGALDLTATPLGSIPLGSIAFATLPLGSIPLGSIGVDWCDDVIEPNLTADPPPTCGAGAQIDPTDPDTTLLAIALQGVPLGSIPLGSIPLGSVPLGSIPLGSIPLGSIDLAASPLGSIPLGSIPLGSISLGSIPLGSIPLGSIPLGSIPLGSIPLGSIPLGSIPLGSIPLGSIPLGSIPLGSIPLGSIPLGSIPLGSIPLGSIPLGSIPLGSIPLGSIPLGSIPLGSIPLGSIPLGSIPLGSIPLGSIPLGSIPLGSIPLGSIPLGSIPLGSIPLGSIPLGSIGQVVDCQQVDCATATLAQAAGAGALRPGATLAQLGSYGETTLGQLGEYGDTTLGQLGEYGDTTLGELRTYGETTLGELGEYGTSVLSELQDVAGLGTLGELGVYGDATVADLAGVDALDGLRLGEQGFGTLADLLGWAEFDGALDDVLFSTIVDGLQPQARDGLTLGSLLQGVIDPGDYPWEDLDIGAAADEIAADTGGVVTFVLEVASALAGASDFDVTIDLPAGFRYVPGSLTYDGVIRSASASTDDATVVEAVLEPRDGTAQVTVDALVPLDVGAVGRASARLVTDVGGETVTATTDGVDQVVAEAFEVNDTPERATPLAPDTLYLTHVAAAADEDWFAIDVARGEQLSVIMSNLDQDLDLVLFGPTPRALRGSADGSVVPAADGGRSLLAEGTVPAVQPLDDVDTTAPAGLSLVGLSVNRGATEERVDTTPLDAGRYFVRVTGYQGATSRRPYALRATVTGQRSTATCRATDRDASVEPVAFDTALPDGMTTLFVVDSERMVSTHDDGADVLAGLDNYRAAVNAGPADDFAGEVAGVLDLADYDGVQGAYSNWDADACDPARANAVVSAIGGVLDGVVAEHPTVEHVVLVGDDDQIPFARVRDATVYSNEREYASQVGDRRSPLATALTLGYLLSDDPYADANPLQVGTRELFVPTVAVGRLVETPTDIVTALDNYVRFGGELDPSTALSTGYDFLVDGAEQVADALGDDTERLIGDDWDADALDAALDAAPGIASINAHFDHNRALPADQNRDRTEENLYTLDDVTDDTAAGLEGSLLFSMGCHGGLSVSDVSVQGGRTADWAQTFSGLGATFVGNTGYGYGDDVVVAATEDLMSRFAVGLDGSLTVGQAMALAKQQYVGATAVVTPFDEKVVSQVVVYGLPQLRLGGGTPEPLPVRPAPTPDARTGLPAGTIEIDGAIGADGGFQAEATDRGTYWTFDGDSSATADQPIQPRSVIDVTTEGAPRLRGLLLTGLQSTDVDLADPVVFTPTVDLGATAPEVSTAPATFPNALQTVRRYESPTGPRDQAVIVPGQYLGSNATQRLFTSIAGTAFYAPAGGPGAIDDQAPRISRSVAVLDDAGQLTLRAEVVDESTVELVTVLYTDAVAPGTWTEVQLADLGGGVWGADLAVSGVSEVDFFTQAVDAGGNVGVSSNKGTYFRSVPLGPPSIALSAAPRPDGWFDGPVTVSATPFAPGGTVDLTVNGVETAGPVELAADGAYEVVATTPGGPSERTTVRIDTAAPVIEAQRSPLASPSTTPVVVSLLGTDAGIGVESVTYTTTGAQVAPAETVSAASADVRISAVGTTTVTAYATDRLGRQSAPVVIDVEIAPPPNLPPVVSADFGKGVQDIGFFGDRPRLEGSFTDADPGPWTVTVTWPGPTAPTTVEVASAGAFAVVGPSLGTVVGDATVSICDTTGLCGSDTIQVRTRVAKTMSPVLECVVDRGAGQNPRYEARFGYQNRHAFWLYVPVGGDNRFSPNPQDRSQPTVFAPGRQRNVFGVPFNGGNLVWGLSGRTATASPGSTRCPPG